MQLSGAYLFYLALKNFLSDVQISAVKRNFLIWTAADAFLNIFFLQSGINFFNYKFLFAFGWFPYFAILAFYLKNKPFHLIFAFSMNALWNFLLHSLSSAIILFKSPMSDQNLIYLAIIYLILFSALFPVEKNLFINIFPAEEFFNNSPMKYFVSFFPLAVFIGTVIPIIGVTFLQTWSDKISRIIILSFYFIIYRSFCISTKKFEDEYHAQKIAHLENQQISQLHEQNLLVTERRQDFQKLREDLTQKYDIIENFISLGKIDDAISFVTRQEHLLQKFSIKKFCEAPLINAALAIYLRRAETIGVKIFQKINLQKNFYTNETDLAVLISNLLENAIKASLKQKENRREISIILQQNGDQCILEISNRFDYFIELGENNLPFTKKFGHGFGMYSLEKFIKKYDAYVDFSHKSNIVKFQIYWEN